MKRKIIISVALVLSFAAQGQTTQYGIKMYEYERYKTAERILAPLADKDPLANYYLGLSQLALKDVSGAAGTFSSRFNQEPANISGKARVAFAQKNVSQGMQIAKSLAELAKKKEWLPLKYAADAINYTEGGDIQQAISWYKTALERADDEDTHIGLGDAYLKIEGGGGEAMNNYEHVTDKDPKNSLAYSRIGKLWYDARNFASALDNYNKAKASDSMNPLPYRDLARAYERVFNYDAAYQNIKRYIQLSDSTDADLTELAAILYGSKHYDEAIPLCRELQKRGINGPQIYGILGLSQMETGDSMDALPNVRKFMLQQNPKLITNDDYLKYGNLFLKLNMLDSAEFYYKKSIASDTARDKSDTYRQIAEIFKGKKEWCRSADWYNSLIRANPNTQPLDYFWRGCMYYYCPNLGKADTAFMQFEEKYPSQHSADYWRGRNGAAIDSEAKTGYAVPFFNKWLDSVGANYDKKAELLNAYHYLLVYYYNKEDKGNEKVYMDKIRDIDPNDKLLKQIEDYEKQLKESKSKSSKPKNK